MGESSGGVDNFPPKPPPQSSELPQLSRRKIGIAEAAEILGVRPAALHTFAKELHQINYIQYGIHGRMLFYQDEILEHLEEYLKQGKETPEGKSGETIQQYFTRKAEEEKQKKVEGAIGEKQRQSSEKPEKSNAPEETRQKETPKGEKEDIKIRLKRELERKIEELRKIPVEELENKRYDYYEEAKLRGLEKLSTEELEEEYDLLYREIRKDEAKARQNIPFSRIDREINRYISIGTMVLQPELEKRYGENYQDFSIRKLEDIYRYYNMDPQCKEKASSSLKASAIFNLLRKKGMDWKETKRLLRGEYGD